MERTQRHSLVKFVPLRVELERAACWNFAERPPLRDVPYVPTPDFVVAKMLEVADVSERDVIYDLGCGDGRIVIAAAKERGARGVGIDIDPDRITQSQLNASKAMVSDRVRFEMISAFRADISDATVVSLYLLPWMTAELRPKLLAEMKPGTRIVAHQFPIGGWPADQVFELPHSDRVVYFWVVPATVKGKWDVTMRCADGQLQRGELDIEQEFSTVVCDLVLDGRDVVVESSKLVGDRLELCVDSVNYVLRVSGDSLRGIGETGGEAGSTGNSGAARVGMHTKHSFERAA